jgi:hypothetical protein
MPTVEEAGPDQSPMNAALKQGIGAISEQQTVTFTLYTRVSLPIDGSLFWVKSELLSKSAIFNAFALNTVPFNEGISVETPAPTFTVQGSLHYSADRNQDESQNYAINRMVFTSEKPVEPLNKIGPATLWIAEFNGLKFAFGSHAFLYQAAGLWHYSGNAVYPDMEPQVIDSLNGFSNKQIVSNSLPIWLSMNRYRAKPWEPFGNSLPLYASYLLPANIPPPWGSVHIPPESTTAIAAAPTFGKTYSRQQFVQETVRVSIYGYRNEDALDFADFVQQYAESTQLFGIMNQPVIRDEKRTQVELSTLSQKKTIDFQINYYQQRVNDIARQLILSAIPTYIFN